MFKRTQPEERTREWSTFEAEAMPHMPDLFLHSGLCKS